MSLQNVLSLLRSRRFFLARLLLTAIILNGVMNETGIWTTIAIALPLALAELHLVRIRLILEQMFQDGQIETEG